MNDRLLQLDTYSELLRPVTLKSIDIDMIVDSIFKNLLMKKESHNAYIPTYYHNDLFWLEYDDKYCYMWVSSNVKIFFENLGVSEKKAESYIKRMMNRHHNISRVKLLKFFILN